MKKKIQFFKDCGVGIVTVLFLLVGTLLFKNMHGYNGPINVLAFIFPLFFIPLLVSVFHDTRYKQTNSKESSKNLAVKPVYKKDTCILVIGTMLTITLIVSMIVLYYGW